VARACINPLKAELNPICHLLALLGAHHILHVSGLRVKFLSLNVQRRSNFSENKLVTQSTVLYRICLILRIRVALRTAFLKPLLRNVITWT
jgi:hypothetical protein